MSLLHLPDETRGKRTTREHFYAVVDLIDDGKQDEADAYLAQVLDEDGAEAYREVCGFISSHYGIPDKDVPRA